ncbi:MAG TPA: OmpA family protein, partial [Burkholderiaceae bacterium]|nr:OmpA family protein [Burkholderiaceae bacterium]
MIATRAGTLGGLLLAALVAACSSTPLNDNNVPVESRTPTSPQEPAPGGNAGSAAGTSQSQVATVDLGKSADDAAGLERVVYFDFDSFVVKDEYRPLIEAHAKRLAADRKKHMSVEGHTDERGGREYNLALGQKRADAVARTLTLLGAADN